MKISQNMPNKIILKVTILHLTTLWRFVATINFESVGQLVQIGLRKIIVSKIGVFSHFLKIAD